MDTEKTNYGKASIVCFIINIIFGVILPTVGAWLRWEAMTGCNGMQWWLVSMILIPLGLLLSILGFITKRETPKKYSLIGFSLNVGLIVLIFAWFYFSATIK